MSTYITKSFADRLQELISDSGKPIKELADEIGISSGALSKYQNDAAVAGIDALAKISGHFDVSTDWLLGLSNDRKRKATATDELGLWESSIAVLTRFNTELNGIPYMALLNSLLSSERFIFLLLDIINLIAVREDAQEEFVDESVDESIDESYWDDYDALVSKLSKRYFQNNTIEILTGFERIPYREYHTQIEFKRLLYSIPTEYPWLPSFILEKLRDHDDPLNITNNRENKSTLTDDDVFWLEQDVGIPANPTFKRKDTKNKTNLEGQSRPEH